MSAQVTEAHRELARRIMLEFTQAGTATASDVRMAAQIIADSEAKACAELRADRDYNHECINRLASATGTLGEKSDRVVEVALSTIDQLRSEVERLRDGGVQRIKDAMAVVMDERDSFKARAERAEADADSTRERALTLANSLDEAQAELAAERARLDWLLSRMGGNVLPANKCVAWTVDVYHYGNRFPSRAAIDAAIKEGA